MILITAGLLALATGCSLTFTGTPTPRPTYTPYPTYTPAPLIELGPTSPLPTPAIQNRIGDAYSSLEQHDADATSVRDNALHRVNRAIPYSNNEHCEEAISDAKIGSEMTPYSEPSYHTSTEAHLTPAACLMDSNEEATALMHLEQAMSIAQVHGYTEEEITGISAILDKPKTSMVPGKTITPQKAGVEKTGLTALTDLQGARWLQQNYPDTARKMAEMPWIADGADPGEEKILEHLILILSRGLQTNVFDPTGKSLRQEDALLMLDMPFLQSIEPGDLPAIRALSSIVQDDSAQFSAILRHPNFQGTITDEWTPIIATLWGAYRNDPSLIPVLLTPGMISLESRKIELPTPEQWNST